MTREYRFVQVDVFTGRVFGGNPLAVVFEAKGLSDGEMQAAADTVDIVSEQGTGMGRPSFIRIRIGMRGGRVDRILVGGGVVPVIQGRLRVP